MSDEVKQVSDVARDIATVKEYARKVGSELKQNIEEVTSHLQAAHGISKALKDAGLELREILGLTSNNPPQDPSEKQPQ